MDIRVEDHGNLHLIVSITDEAKDWIDGHVDVPDHMRIGGNTIAVEHGCSSVILEAASDDGLVVAA